jgi:phage shock protein PspC (stress-responsive transcriptional regulator)
MTRRLERSATDRVIAGVCGGLAEHLQIDATLVRAVFIIAGLLSAGLFVLGYIALLFLMPLPGQRAPIEDIWQPSTVRPAAGTADTSAEGEVTPPARAVDPEEDARRQRWIGYVLLGLGAVFLLSEVGAFRFVRGDVLWPLAIIGLGLFFILRRGRP